MVVVPVCLPFILNPVDMDASYNINDEKVGKKLKVELLDNTVFGGKNIDLMQGNKVVCFFSLNCQLCEYTMQKLAILERKNNNELPIYFIYWGKEKTSSELLKKVSSETRSQNILHKFLDTDKFFQMAGTELPAVYFLQNGVITKKTNYRDMFPEEVEAFLKKTAGN